MEGLIFGILRYINNRSKHFLSCVGNFFVNVKFHGAWGPNREAQLAINIQKMN